MVFLAELGDRSQVVLPGVAVAAFLVHGVAVNDRPLPGRDSPGAAAGLRVRRRSHPDHARTPIRDHDWAGVWIGGTVGMVLADGLAVGVGTLLNQPLPEHLLHVLASLLFLMFGLWMLFDSALGWRSIAIAVIASVALAVATMAAAQTLRRRRAEATIAGRSPDIV